MQKLTLTTQEELETLMRSIIRDELSEFLKKLQGKEHQLMSASEVATLYSISRVTVYKMKKDGRLPFININSRIRFPREAVMKILESRA